MTSIHFIVILMMACSISKFRSQFTAGLFAGIILLALPAAAQLKRDVHGKWRGEFLIRDGIKAPFNFEIDTAGKVYLINGSERFETGEIIIRNDSAFIALDQFDNELAFKIGQRTWTGVFRRQDHTGTPTPVIAAKGSHRFRTGKKGTKNVAGTYAVEFQYESGKKEGALAVLEQNGSRLTGTFLKPSGDTRYLEGTVDGNRFYLSSFIGSSPGYYEGTIADNGKMEGFQAGTRVKNLFSGKLAPGATIKDPFSVSSLKEGQATISFKLPDVNGKPVSLTDEKYRNKVVVLAITGTWCPNCIDEAAFLSPWYRENRERGVEIITIHFERQTDTAFTNKVMNRFRKRFNIEYDQVLGGMAQPDSVMTALQGLQSFSSFPTTIFIDKQGRVSKIHSGYTGPATGKFYDEFVREFNKEADRLLEQ